MRQLALSLVRIAAVLLVVATVGGPLAWLVWERGDAYVHAAAARLEQAAGHFSSAVDAHGEYAAALPRHASEAGSSFARMRPVGERARAEILAGADAVREETLEALTLAASLPALPLGPRYAGARSGAARGTTLYVEVAEAFEPLLDHLTFDRARAAVLADFFAYDPLRDLGDAPMSSPTEFAVRSAATAARHRETERQLLDLSPRPALISAHHRLATSFGGLAERALEARTAMERRDGPAALRALADHRAAVAAAQQLALEQITTQAKDPALSRSAGNGISLVRDALRQHHEALAEAGPIEAVARAGLPREVWAAALGAVGLVLVGTIVALRRRHPSPPSLASATTYAEAPETSEAPEAGWLARRLSWPVRSDAQGARPDEGPPPAAATGGSTLPDQMAAPAASLPAAPAVELRVVGRGRELSIERDGVLLRPVPLPFGRRADFVAAFTAQLKRYREQERVLRVLHERGLQRELSSMTIEAAFVEPIQDPSFLSIAFPEVAAREWRELPTRDVYGVVEACLIANDLGGVALRLAALRPPLDPRAPAWVAVPDATPDRLGPPTRR